MTPLAWFVSRIFTLDVMPFLALFLPLLGFVVLSLFEPGIRRDREEKGAAIVACAPPGVTTSTSPSTKGDSA